ncbi:ABC transporter, periplasmic glycine/betaine-binding protein, putative [Burkholderia thailandensis E264]|uniref:ABC transporter, periplasmic glycine/betaine-binding protein, putative n=2 Tax=Burkholderia thailandensis TaxID=57975 RepID=Q2SW00_BURTA|nr:ABC transporter, periplasmic glycine/betaine-binding protein, putative [Burkholderia thailandensis E264]
MRSPKRLDAIIRDYSAPRVNAPLFAKARPLKYLDPLPPAIGPASPPAECRLPGGRRPLHPLICCPTGVPAPMKVPRFSRSLRAAAAALAVSVCATAPGAHAAGAITVASKIDTEGNLLGNVIAQVLKAHGIAVVDKIGLGATPIVRKALTTGEIDIYPEYTGNAAFFFNKADDPAWKNAAQGYALARQLDYAANRIVWLAPAPANNTWGVAVLSSVAQAQHLKTFSDFGRWVGAGGKVKLAASAEFVNSASALPSFEKVYGFKLKQEQMLVLSGGDTAATIKAAAQQTDGVNAAMVYGTDGGIAAAGLTVLDDDKHVQPVYAPTPIIREAVLKAHPQIADYLKPVFAGLDLKTLQTLNARIQINGEPAASVAASYLKAKGFVK